MCSLIYSGARSLYVVFCFIQSCCNAAAMHLISIAATMHRFGSYSPISLVVAGHLEATHLLVLALPLMLGREYYF